jgi:mRNA interferase MazF
LTSNLKRANAPGNVSLAKDEGNLIKQSVVNVSQIFAVDKSRLNDYIGTISPKRLRQVLEGIKLVIEPREPEPHKT